MLGASAGRNPAGALRVGEPDSASRWSTFDIGINIALDWHHCQRLAAILVSIGTSHSR